MAWEVLSYLWRLGAYKTLPALRFQSISSVELARRYPNSSHKVSGSTDSFSSSVDDPFPNPRQRRYLSPLPARAAVDFRPSRVWSLRQSVAVTRSVPLVTLGYQVLSNLQVIPDLPSPSAACSCRRSALVPLRDQVIPSWLLWSSKGFPSPLFLRVCALRLPSGYSLVVGPVGFWPRSLDFRVFHLRRVGYPAYRYRLF